MYFNLLNNIKKKLFFFFISLLVVGSFLLLPLVTKNTLNNLLTLNQITLFVDLIIFTIFTIYFYYKIDEQKITNFIKYVIFKLSKVKLINLIIFILIFIFGTYYFTVVHQSQSLDLFYPRTIYGFIKTISMFIEKISWIYGLLIGITFVLTYRILRFTLNRFLSNFCALVFISSEIHLYNLIPSIERDYFKVILFLILSILFILIFKSTNDKKINIKFYLISIIIGFSLTIRNDFLIYLIPFMVSIFMIYKKSFKKPLVYLLIITFTFLIIPARGTLVGSMPIVLLTGLMGNFDLILGQTSDYVLSNISEQPFVEYYLDKMSMNYLIFYSKYLITFSFDLMGKFFFATNEIFNLSYIYSSEPLLFEGYIKKIYLIKSFLLENLIGFGSFIFIISLILLRGSFKNYDLYFLLILYILFLTSSTTIYFYARHYFHLEILSLWSLFYLIQYSINIISNEKKS
tara:strand:+ start:740 stop:2116 length:1377 start_codon:yes stop_codon:yes gene_type:complete